MRHDIVALIRALPPHERPRGLLLTTRRFTLEGGEVTANLKLRRRAVEAQFASSIADTFAALEARARGRHHDGASEASDLRVHWVLP